MIEVAALMRAVASLDEFRTVAGSTVVYFDVMVLVMREIAEGGNCPGSVKFVVVGHKSLYILAFGCEWDVLGGNDDLLHCSIPAEIAIASKNLSQSEVTSMEFSSFMSPFASTRLYSITLRSLFSSTTWSTFPFPSRRCGPPTSINSPSSSEVREGEERCEQVNASGCAGEDEREEDWVLFSMF